MNATVRYELDVTKSRNLKDQLLAHANQARDTSDQMMQGEAGDCDDEQDSSFFDKQQQDYADDYAVNEEFDCFDMLNMAANDYQTTQANNQY